jgi:hypothetical protein
MEKSGRGLSAELRLSDASVPIPKFADLYIGVWANFGIEGHWEGRQTPPLSRYSAWRGSDTAGAG